MEQPILLLHGALGSKQQFDKIATGLNINSFALNFSGHGGLPLPNNFNVELFTKDIIVYLDKNQIPKVDLFGYSLGGYVALYTAFLFPDRVNKICTLSTKFDWNPDFTQDQVLKLNPAVIENKVPHFAAHLKQEHEPQDWKLIMEKTSEMMVGLSLTTPLSANSLRQIAHPVTLGIGRQDKMVSIEETEQAAAQLQNGNVKQLDAPHEIAKTPTATIAQFISESLT